MKILYIGDIMGSPGIDTVRRTLPDLQTELRPDLVIAQAENVTGGKGLSPADFDALLANGIDFCTGGNWSVHDPAIIPFLDDPASPVIRPANYPDGTPGLGRKYAKTPHGDVLVISLLGHIVGRDADKPTDNPLKVVDAILAEQKGKRLCATVVNFHGDYSSEKRTIGYYLDGKVTAVIGDHWHVPTADASILPKGTAHITDVGMCGSVHSSLGVKFSSVIPRWHDDIKTPNILETKGPYQFNAVLIESDPKTGVASSIHQLQKVIN